MGAWGCWDSPMEGEGQGGSQKAVSVFAPMMIKTRGTQCVPEIGHTLFQLQQQGWEGRSLSRLRHQGTPGDTRGHQGTPGAVWSAKDIHALGPLGALQERSQCRGTGCM